MSTIPDPRSRMFLEHRPWGTFEQFSLNEPTTVKIITVLAGQRLSLQTHEGRAEFWRVIDGALDITVGERTWRAGSGETAWIPVGVQHRLGNSSGQPGRVLEIAFGEFDEDDIHRLDDDYARDGRPHEDGDFADEGELADSALPLRIHTICTGNICRSAFAAGYLRARLGEIAPDRFEVASSGTGWLDHLEVPAEIHALGADHDVPMHEHVGRYAVAEHYRAADLILTATREHRQQVLESVPAAMNRTFLITEFAALLQTLDLHPGADRAAWLDAIKTAATQRARVVPTDVPDPYRQGRAAYDEMAATMIPALDRIVERAGSVVVEGVVQPG